MIRLSASLLLAFLLLGCGRSSEPAGDPEERVVAYLNETVTPGKQVLVTDMLNNVFTTPEEQQAVQRLYDALFQLPGFVAIQYQDSGKIPTLQEITTHFAFRVPGTTEALLKILESDPRIPPFFRRDPSTGEIIAVDVETIRAADRFGLPLQNRN